MRPALQFMLSVLCFLSIAPSVTCQKTTLQLLPVLKPATAGDTAILAQECLSRRNIIAQKLQEGVIVIHNNENTSKDFYYLTGWTGSPSYAFIDLKPVSFTLLIQPSNAQSIIWNGKDAGEAEAKKLGANTKNYFELKKQLKELVKSGKRIYTLKNDKILRENLKGLLLTKSDSSRIIYFDSTVHEMRVIKSSYEVENIKKAIGVTANALANAIRNTRSGTYEYEIAALFDYENKRNGITESFPGICGSGVNSTALHYEKNNKLMVSGEVLLMDVGSEYLGYASDITRTIPVNGKFSRTQLDLYEIVLKAQTEAIKLMKPGNKFMDFHNKSADIIIKGLFQLGFLTDTTKTWQKSVFILYRAGHYLGLNVHDVGRYGDENSLFRPGPGRELVPGMVITVEPGIYINPEMLKFVYDIYGSTVPKAELDEFVKHVAPAFTKYANIGIRIEDDILITGNGNENLSQAVPKQPEDIERLMNKK